MSYEVLKNRLTNGTAFLLQTALDLSLIHI